MSDGRRRRERKRPGAALSWDMPSNTPAPSRGVHGGGVDGLDDLVARGLITRPTETADWAAFDRMPAPRLKGNELLEAVLADRDEG